MYLGWKLAAYSLAYTPPWAIRLWWVPSSQTPFSSSTTMRWAPWMVESRWAITKVVRWRAKSSKERCTTSSLWESRALVASSKMRMGGSFKKARAMESRWRWPPESFPPRGPMSVS